MQRVDLSANQLTRSSVHQITEALQHNSSITRIDLGNNLHISRQMLIAVSNQASKNQRALLRHVDRQAAKARDLIAAAERLQLRITPLVSSLNWRPCTNGAPALPPNAAVRLGQMHEYSDLDTLIEAADGSLLAHSTVLNQGTQYSRCLLVPSHSGFSLQLPSFSLEVCQVLLNWIYCKTSPSLSDMMGSAAEVKALAEYLGVGVLGELCRGAIASSVLDRDLRPQCLGGNRRIEPVKARDWLEKVEGSGVFTDSWDGRKGSG